MAKAGRGILMIATDIDPAHEAEINDWYDHEHLEERVAIPGFVCARRYRALAAERKYLALYETEKIDVFDGAEYRRRLANQTDRSKRALGNFRRTHRAVGRLALSHGLGMGAALVMMGLPGSAGAAGDATREQIVRLFAKVMARPELIAAHLLESDARLSQPLAETGPASVPLAAPDDWFLVIEGADASALQDMDSPALASDLEALKVRRLGTYMLMVEMSHDDLR